MTSPGKWRPLNGLCGLIGMDFYPTRMPAPKFATEPKGSDVSSRKPADATTSEDHPEAAVACGTQVPDPCLRQRFQPREAHAVEPKQRLICRYPESPIFRLGEILDP